MARKLTFVISALVCFVPALAAGCGGSSSGSTLTKGNLGVTQNLKVAQDQADIQEFCNLAPSPKGELYDRAFVAVIPATDDLVGVYKKKSDGTYWDALKKREIKLRQVVSDLAKQLNGCGKDGKVQAAKLTRALQGK